MGSSHKSKAAQAKNARPEERPATRRSSPRTARIRSTAAVGARPRIRGALGDALRAEITALERARSVVDCLAAAMEAGAAGARGPYYPDVAHAASEMMNRTIVTLSDLLLDSP